MKVWRTRDFRVWAVRMGSEPVIEGYVACDRLEPHKVILSGPMPLAAWLKDDMTLESIELHHDTCGNPGEYLPERIMFKCKVDEPLHWKIEPVSTLDSGDKDYAWLTVELGCETESVYRQVAP